jgi:hypothetical protein
MLGFLRLQDTCLGMPIDTARFQAMLKEMKEIYDKDPVGAVRGKSFIKILDAYCLYELSRLGIKPEADMTIGTGEKGHKKTKVIMKQEVTIFGSHRPKDIDVCVYSSESGALLAVSTRSQMSSVGKNIINYYEGIIGDVISLHQRSPCLVIGEIYLLPTAPIKLKDGKVMKEKIDYNAIARLFKNITNRSSSDAPPDKYEQFAFLVVDFSKPQPELIDLGSKYEDLKIDDFFDKLLETYNERNPFLRLGT